jgi:hypothetical protein
MSLGRPCPPYIRQQTRSVNRSPGRLQQGNLSLFCLHHGKLIRAALIRLDILVLHTKLSLGPHVRSDRPTDRSASLLVGRTHLSVTAMSLVGGDLGVPMSHNTKEVHTRCSLPPDHPSLSQDLTMKLSS